MKQGSMKVLLNGNNKLQVNNTGSLIPGFFPPINIQLAFLNPEFYIQTQCFRSTVGRAACLHCSLAFYIKNLSIFRFWYLQGSCNQPPSDTEDCGQVFWESKITLRFSAPQGLVPRTPTLYKYPSLLPSSLLCPFSHSWSHLILTCSLCPALGLRLNFVF